MQGFGSEAHAKHTHTRRSFSEWKELQLWRGERQIRKGTVREQENIVYFREWYRTWWVYICRTLRKQSSNANYSCHCVSFAVRFLALARSPSCSLRPIDQLYWWDRNAAAETTERKVVCQWNQMRVQSAHWKWKIGSEIPQVSGKSPLRLQLKQFK